MLRDAKAAWEDIKTDIVSAPTLAYHDFSRGFKMYVDVSREWGFGVAVHQADTEGVERPILFLSRRLTPAQANYGATKLECAALVWALQKLPHYFDAAPFTVVTDHAALVHALQNTSVQRSARLNRWAIFLASFLPRMTIEHRQGTLHANADTLSRYPGMVFGAQPVPPTPLLNELVGFDSL